MASGISTPPSRNTKRGSTPGIILSIPYVNLAAAYALEGKTEEAKTALAEGRRLNPKLTVKWLIDHAADIPPLLDGVRKAGLPEE